MQINCTPPRNNTAIKVVAWPVSSCPPLMRTIATTGMARMLSPAEMNPKYMASCSGKYEKLVMASLANLSIFFSGYLVSPEKRAARRYCTPVCLKPTHTDMPRKKRWRSRIWFITSTTLRSSRRKSPVSIGIFTSVIR